VPDPPVVALLASGKGCRCGGWKREDARGLSLHPAAACGDVGLLLAPVSRASISAALSLLATRFRLEDPPLAMILLEAIPALLLLASGGGWVFGPRCLLSCAKL
jgi:hypothetical protein